MNAYAKGSDLWCAPGGGIEPGTDLPENLRREVYEETGLDVAVGALALLNEFHEPRSGFHQVDLFFRCTVTGGGIDPDWRDPTGTVNERRLFAQGDMAAIRFKPDSLAEVAFSDADAVRYDPLETMVG